MIQSHGVPYFSIDVNFDKKIKILTKKYGAQSGWLWIKILQSIYGQEGYYLELNDDTIELLSDEIPELDIEKVINIINFMIEKNIFNRELYEKYSILTSSGIQSRYISIVQRRREVRINDAFLLPGIKKRCNDLKNITLYTDSTYSESCNSVQHMLLKGKERKESKESKGKESNTDLSIGDSNVNYNKIPFDKFWDLYNKKVGKSKCEAKWKKLSKTIQEKALLHIVEYVKATPDVQFRKNPLTYLNGNSWDDDIIIHSRPVEKINKNDMVPSENCDSGLNLVEMMRYKVGGE